MGRAFGQPMVASRGLRGQEIQVDLATTGLSESTPATAAVTLGRGLAT